MNELIPMTLLAAGELAQVGCVVGQPEQVHRLEEMGLRGGVELEMVRPGNPCIIRLGGSKLCFRAEDGLLHVLVRTGVAV